MSHSEIAKILERYSDMPVFVSPQNISISPSKFTEVFHDFLQGENEDGFFEKLVFDHHYSGKFYIVDCALLLDQIELAKKWLTYSHIKISDRALGLMLNNEKEFSNCIIQALNSKKITLLQLFNVVKSKCDYMIKDPKEYTLVHYLTTLNLPLLLSKLKANVDIAEINASNVDGDTPLQVALKNQYWGMIKPLIELGAKTDIPNKEGQTLQSTIDFYAKLKQLVLKLNQKYPGTQINDFDNATTEFLQEVKLSNFNQLFTLKSFIQQKPQCPHLKLIRTAFWSLSALDYLQRSEFSLQRTKLTLCTPKETELYKALAEANINTIPYRTTKDDDNIAYQKEFYCHGTLPRVTRLMLRDLGKTFLASYENSPFYVGTTSDLYSGVREIINFAQYSELNADEHGLAYVLSAIPKDDHIYTMLSIIDTQLRRPVGHYFINSWDKKEYYLYTLERLNMEYKDAEILAAPLFNLSLRIQVNATDGNCALYTFENIQRMVKMWQDGVHRQHFTNLGLYAKQTFDKIIPHQDDSDKDRYVYKMPVMEQFTRALKTQLRNLFQDTPEQKPLDALRLRDFFLKMRWLVSNNHLFHKRQRAKEKMSEIDQALGSDSVKLLRSQDPSPLQSYLLSETDISDIKYMVFHQPIEMSPQVKPLVDSLLAPLRLGLTGLLTLVASTFRGTNRLRVLGLSTHWISLAFMAIFIHVLFPVCDYVVSKIKKRALTEYNDKNLDALKQLTTGQTDAFLQGVDAVNSSKAQFLSCFNRNAILNYSAYYAGYAAKENNTAKDLITEIKLVHACKSQI